MSTEWIAISVSVVIALVSIVTGWYQASQARAAAIASERVRADIADLMLKILDRIDVKLDDYVRAQNWKDYNEGHSKEHNRIEQELTRLRDAKDMTDRAIRSVEIRDEETIRSLEAMRRKVDRLPGDS